MASGAQCAWCLLGKVACLLNQGVGVAMAAEIGGVAGDALAARGLAGSAASQGAVDRTVAGAATKVRMGLTCSHKRCGGGNMARYAVDHGRSRGRIDLD